MAPLNQKSVVHFTHPNHQLIEINNDNAYLCDGCKTPGTGKRFRCHGCDFDLHGYCGTCPMTLSSFMHSHHQLNLVQRKPQATRQKDRICDVCRDSVEGLFYRCKICDFDVHPVCTQLPQQVRHVLDPTHPLTLQPISSSSSSSSWCVVCRNECTFWRYRCGICGIDIHLQCLLTPSSSSASASPSTPRSRPNWQPGAFPAAAPSTFGAYNVPSYSAGAHNGYANQPPYFGTCNYSYGVPFNPYNPMFYQQQHHQGNQLAGGGGGLAFGRIMFKLVEDIVIGVISNEVFGEFNL